MPHETEIKLILWSLSAKEDDEPVHFLHGVSPQAIDWSYVLLFSRHNSIAPLLFHNLKKLGFAGLMPEETRLTFEKIYHGVGFQNALYMKELQHLLHIFNRGGINTIVLKGAAIAEDVFGNIGLRQMADIDLLVQEKDLVSAEALLSESGYIPDEYQQSRAAYRIKHHHLAPYSHPERNIVVEIHRHIISTDNPFGIKTDKLWDRAREGNIGTMRILILSAEDMIIHTCLHLAYCGGFIGGLRSLTDIAQAIRHYGDRMDWDWLVEESCKHNYQNYVYYPLHLAKHLLGAPIPDGVIENLKRHSRLNRLDISLLNLITRNILLKEQSSSLIPKGYLALCCRQLLCDSPLHHKMRLLMQRLFGKTATDSGAPLNTEPGDNAAVVPHVLKVFSRIISHAGKAIIHKGKISRRQH